ncbi:signal recognition particle subunit [Cryptotrichosporon argae]
MPTVEDYFDDDTDLPLPSGSGSGSRHLSGSGIHGALLEEIGDDSDTLDFGKLAEQARGEYGADAVAPPPRPPNAFPDSGKGKTVARGGDDDEQRPLTPMGPGGPRINPNTPMGGFMGDMMKLQEAEEARLEKVRRQFGNTHIAKDPSAYKTWNTVYPLYFDAKASATSGRRVPRKAALWWPQATHIAKACASLGLQSVLEPEKTHPADWENPGRVKVQFVKDGKFANPIVKNRTQLYAQLAAQMQRANPSLMTQPKSASASIKPKPPPAKAIPATKAKKASSSTKPVVPAAPRRLPTRAPPAPQPLPALDERLPLHSPIVATGVAVSAVKRDLEAEKEAKKKGAIEGPGAGGEAKPPKMKRMVVRGKR